MAKNKTKKKKMSQTTKEIIKTAIFVVVVALLVAVYVIYPLIKTNDVLGRENMEAFENPDSLPVNDPAACLETGLACDTFRVDSDGLTNLASLYLPPQVDPAAGTVILLHGDMLDRSAMLPWAQAFVDSGYQVILYDQRASGYSSGKYHGEGFYEANDLEAVIPYLDIRDRVTHPFVVVGRGVGGDAAYLAALDESRIDAVVAIEPYLSTSRMWEIKQEDYDLWSFPFFKTMMWWWYNIRSGYAAPYREPDDLEAVPVPSLIYLPEPALDSEEAEVLRELSEQELLTIRPLPPEGDLLGQIFSFIATLAPPAGETTQTSSE